MTPDDVAAVRAYVGRPRNEIDRKLLALCDALEAAWAERDYLESVEAADAMLREWRERAERAEKRCDELRPWAARWAREGQVAVEALARVRDLCDGRPAHDYLEVARIRAAIEGDNQ